MAIVATDNKHYADIANAIREKTGTENTYKPEQMAVGVGEVYEAGNPLKYVTSEGAVNSLFYASAFPEGYELVIDMPSPPTNINSMFRYVTGVRKITLIVPTTQVYNTSYLFYFYQSTDSVSSLEEVVIPEGLKSSNFGRFVGYCRKLKSIKGSIDLSENTVTSYCFNGCEKLEEVRFVPNTIKLGFNISYSPKLSDLSIESIVNGLADLTGQTAQQVQFHSEILEELTNAQMEAISGKNWTI